jgi:hypothetical protein
MFTVAAWDRVEERWAIVLKTESSAVAMFWVIDNVNNYEKLVITSGKDAKSFPKS